jgi:UDP-galactopyranose mutase
MPEAFEYLVVGAGFSGAVLARELAEKTDKRVLVVDERRHIAGNCHTARDQATDVMVHVYGPHIFSTDSVEAWNYVQRFGKFRSFSNRVKAHTPRGIFSFPINLLTINQFFGKQFNPAQAQAFLASLGDSTICAPKNFEEQALKFIGRELYDAFFYGYTCKQWGCEPRELPASLLQRLPIRFNYNDVYYDTQFQAIPEQGYTAIIEKILDHPQIEVRLNTRFDPKDGAAHQHVFYTGPIDAYFGFNEGRLSYRTVHFERIEAEGDYQGNAVINYTGLDVPYTRVHEHKHFAPWETHSRTVAFREFSKTTEPHDVPYYPVRNEADKAILNRYAMQAGALKEVSFLGRLATYRYLDMDDVICEALAFSQEFLSAQAKGRALPVFSVQPNH